MTSHPRSAGGMGRRIAGATESAFRSALEKGRARRRAGVAHARGWRSTLLCPGPIAAAATRASTLPPRSTSRRPVAAGAGPAGWHVRARPEVRRDDDRPDAARGTVRLFGETDPDRHCRKGSLHRQPAEHRVGLGRWTTYRRSRMSVKVYLAGPEVFLPNARELLDQKIALTRAAGLIPVSPGDLAIPAEADQARVRARDQRHRRAADGRGRCDHRQPDAVPRHRGRHRHRLRTRLHVRPRKARLRLLQRRRRPLRADQALLRRRHAPHRRWPRARAGRPEPRGLRHDRQPDARRRRRRRGGVMVRRDVPEAERYTDTAAFEECLRLLAGT